VRVIGDKTERLPAPPHVVWADLMAPRAEGVRAWLRLLPDEVAPTVLDSREPDLVVWSSLWSRHPEVVVRLEPRPNDRAPYGTALRVVLEVPEEAEISDAAIGHLRKRITYLLSADLRFSYGQ